MELTVGMATYRDFDGVYFTIQALRLYQDMAGVEVLVVDNFGCPDTRAFVEGAGGRYVLAPESMGTAAPRDLVFREARGEAVLCLDSHVLLVEGAIARLRRYYREHPDCADLLQGPLVYDNLDEVATHFEPVWRDGMWGFWARDARSGPGPGPDAEPFEIPMQGLGLFSCRKAAWPGFHPGFRGFGGEEGYIHEKFRRLGRRCLCLPWLRWVHRFGRLAGPPYPMRLRDRITNYLIGHGELGLDVAPVLEHFGVLVDEAEMDRAIRDADSVLAASGAPAIHGPRPIISCLCPTFGRCGTPWQHLLEEAVESFLRQTDTRSELLIFNDHPAQEVVFDHPRVRVVNATGRHPTLGEKLNSMVAMASGPLLARWDDDDISLPHRLELSRERLGDRDYYNPRRYWLLNHRGLLWDSWQGVGHTMSLFRRGAWQVVGGYPAVSGSEDMEIDGALNRHPEVRCRVDEEPLRVPDWFYIYRWGVSPCHLSGGPDMQARYDAGARAPAPAGRFELRPHWRNDYSALVAAASARWRETAHGRIDGRRAAPRRAGSDATYKKAAAYLEGVGQVEDWGCGVAYFRRFVPEGSYRGVDRDPTSAADHVADLADHTSATDGLLLRHVLEYDRRWRAILRNALASFRRRLVLVVSTPFVRATAEHRWAIGGGPEADGVEIHFSRRDLVGEFGGIPFRLEENLATDSPSGREHVFYLCKDGPA